jgi:transaldolase
MTKLQRLYAEQGQSPWLDNLMRPVFDTAEGTDSFVSVEALELTRDAQSTIVAARRLYQGIDEPNLLVKIPAAAEGVPVVQTMVAEGHSINITLIFSLPRYAEVIAYLASLAAVAQAKFAYPQEMRSGLATKAHQLSRR